MQWPYLCDLSPEWNKRCLASSLALGIDLGHIVQRCLLDICFFKFLFVCCWPMTIMFVLDFRCSFVIYGNQYQSIYWLLKIQNSLQQLLICHQYCHCASLWHGNHFPFLAMVLEHLELEGQTWHFYMRYFITRTIAITTTIIAIMIMVRGWSVIEGSDQH